MRPLRLEGPALRAFQAVPADDRRTYAKAIDALHNCFSPVERQSVQRAALNSRHRKPEKDFSELADDVLLLTSRAYPGIDSEALDQLAAETSLDALDIPLCRRVRDEEPEILNIALSSMQWQGQGKRWQYNDNNRPISSFGHHNPYRRKREEIC